MGHQPLNPNTRREHYHVTLMRVVERNGNPLSLAEKTRLYALWIEVDALLDGYRPPSDVG